VIKSEGDAHGAKVKAAIGMDGGLRLLGDSQWRRVWFGDMQRHQDNIVRRRKHNDGMLVLAICL
jgi:hypothetical protein